MFLKIINYVPYLRRLFISYLIYKTKKEYAKKIVNNHKELFRTQDFANTINSVLKTNMSYEGAEKWLLNTKLYPSYIDDKWFENAYDARLEVELRG